MIEEQKVWDALKTVIDPEIPVNVVDLGLVYNVAVADEKVRVDMTLTIRGCPMHTYIARDTKAKLMQIPGVKEAEVNVVWDPPWNQGMMTEAAKLQLGLY